MTRVEYRSIIELSKVTEGKAMKTLKFQCRGEWYKVKPNGDMIQTTNKYNEWDDGWRFLGISRHHWRQGIDVTVEQAFSDPDLLIGGIVWDVDHGTTRQWGGSWYGKLPRITAVYVDES